MEDDVRQSGADRYAVSQAHRWKAERDKAMQELRQLKDRSRGTTMSAYDLLPQEERDAIAWVREHGGLERVKAQRRESMPRAAYERKKAGFLDHIAECERALGSRRDAIARIASENDAIRLEIAQMRPRLMPEGMEWPMYEDGEPVRIGDVVELETGCIPVEAIEFSRGKVCVKDAEDGDWSTSSYAMHPLKRPEPKVLAADGEPLLNGDEVWRVKDGSGPYHVQEIRNGASVCVGETWLAFRPDELTHQRPALDAGGAPIKVGDTVFRTSDGREFEVTGVDGAFEIRVKDESMDVGIWTTPCGFTHAKPEFPDSWERLEEDATVYPETYCVRRGIDIADVDGTHLVLDDVTELMARDLVRRAKKLAERGER